MRTQSTLTRSTLITGAAVLACALFTACGGPNTSTSPHIAPLSFAEAQTVITKMMISPAWVEQSGSVLLVSAPEDPNNPNEAELSQATGWKIGLEQYPGPKDPDPQHPWAKYDQAITTEGLHFTTDFYREIDSGDDMGLEGEVVNINGCLAVKRISDDDRFEYDPEYAIVIPIFGEWKSVAPSLRVGDRISGGGSGVTIWPNDKDVTIPKQCRDSGIAHYFALSKVSHVNCFLLPMCRCYPDPPSGCPTGPIE